MARLKPVIGVFEGFFSPLIATINFYCPPVSLTRKFVSKTALTEIEQVAERILLGLFTALIAMDAQTEAILAGVI